MRKSNMRKLTQVLHDLEKLSHKTTWKEAQELLIEQPAFIDDKDLQNMDKEDALGKINLINRATFIKILFF